MIVFLITEALDILYTLGKVSYKGIIWIYNWYFNISLEEQKELEMKTLEERVQELERLLKENETSSDS
jgi:hypothetical protein